MESKLECKIDSHMAVYKNKRVKLYGRILWLLTLYFIYTEVV